MLDEGRRDRGKEGRKEGRKERRKEGVSLAPMLLLNEGAFHPSSMCWKDSVIQGCQFLHTWKVNSL
jgi:hypothetical protein